MNPKPATHHTHQCYGDKNSPLPTRLGSWSWEASASPALQSSLESEPTQHMSKTSPCMPNCQPCSNSPWCSGSTWLQLSKCRKQIAVTAVLCSFCKCQEMAILSLRVKACRPQNVCLRLAWQRFHRKWKQKAWNTNGLRARIWTSKFQLSEFSSLFWDKSKHLKSQNPQEKTNRRKDYEPIDKACQNQNATSLIRMKQQNAQTQQTRGRGQTPSSPCHLEAVLRTGGGAGLVRTVLRGKLVETVEGFSWCMTKRRKERTHSATAASWVPRHRRASGATHGQAFARKQERGARVNRNHWEDSSFSRLQQLDISSTLMYTLLLCKTEPRQRAKNRIEPITTHFLQMTSTCSTAWCFQPSKNIFIPWIHQSIPKRVSSAYKTLAILYSLYGTNQPMFLSFFLSHCTCLCLLPNKLTETHKKPFKKTKQWKKHRTTIDHHHHHYHQSYPNSSSRLPFHGLLLFFGFSTRLLKPRWQCCKRGVDFAGWGA